ncbi:endonuclease/exonuclease/phosphatase family protein [Nonomuraea sp. NPDC050536]|uniref:endonuclease/exonuclease/phosphatase family protein n=1 Tax=Nonomuraea sp. NPDC050536 TaxID=3364366 RepID=UPI0037CB5C22
MRAVVWVLVVPFAVWAALRVSGLAPVFRWVQVVAFTPYAALAAIIPLALAGALRRWVAAGVALASAVALGVAVLPRFFGDGNPEAGGMALRVLSANLEVGSGDAAELEALVRRLRPDVLTLQELTPAAAARLAGVRRLLPHVVDRSAPGASGSGIFSRFPLSEEPVIEVGFRQARAVLRPPGGPAVEIVSVHPCAPRFAFRAACWAQGLQALPRAGGMPRVLAGDFNATLDHAPLRDLLASGYRDAADVTGQGLTATWPMREWGLLPGVTIDHVLADARIAIRSYGVQTLTGTDHRPVFAELRLP